MLGHMGHGEMVVVTFIDDRGDDQGDGNYDLMEVKST